MLIVALALVGCSDDSDSGAGSDEGAADAGMTSGSTSDAGGVGDAGSVSDSGVTADSGATADSSGSGDDAESDAASNGLPARPWAVDMPGFYNVGYRTLTANYTTIAGIERELRVVIWYPTLDADGDRPLYTGLLPRDEVILDAALAPPEGADAKLPVMIFSHGNTGFAEQSYFMTEFMATHGWVVVSLDHTGNTYTQEEFDPAIFYDRPMDVSAVLDTVYELPEGDPMAGRLSDDVVMAGHSFGGYTTLLVSGAAFDVDGAFALCDAGAFPMGSCDPLREPAPEAQLREGFLDERIDVAIPMTPGVTWLMGEGIGEIAIPTMLMTAALDETTTNEVDGDPTWAELKAPGSIRIDFQTAGHFTFSNACDAFPGIFDGDGCGEGFLSFEEALPAINTFVLAFSRFHLFGESELEPLLTGAQEVSSDAVISTVP